MKSPQALTLGLTALFLIASTGADASAFTASHAGLHGSPEAIAPASQTFQLAQRRRRSLSWRVGVRPSRYRVGAFSRSGECPNQAKITAFVPPPRSEEQVAKNNGTVDFTLSSHPTFWVHVANLKQKAPVQFTIQDAAGNQELYNTRFILDGQTGIVGVRLPKTKPGLKVGESYLWQMTVQCEAGKELFIGSWVQRLTPDQIKATADFDPKPLVQALARASDRDKPALYAELGVWQDAVTALIDLQQKQFNNKELSEDWRSLLMGAQMGEFITAPILGVK